MAFIGSFTLSIPVFVPVPTHLRELVGGVPDFSPVETVVPTAKAWVTRVEGDKLGVLATLRVYNDPDKTLELAELQIAFMPDGDERWDKQAYLQFAGDARIAGMVSDE